MNRQAVIKNKGLDWIMISIFVSLVLIGWMMVYSSSYDENNIYNFLDLSSEIGKQSLFVVISFLIFVALLTVEWNFWNSFAFPLYAISLILLILVLFIGDEIKGNKSWINLGFTGFQPSEIAKFGTCLAIASYLSFNKNNLKDNKVLITAISIFAVPIILVLLQPDAGSALVFLSFFMLLYRKGLSPLLYILGFILLGIFIFALTIGAYIVSICTLFGLLGILLFNLKMDIKKLIIFIVILFATYFIHNKSIYNTYSWLLPATSVLIAAFYIYKKNNLRVLSLTAVSGIMIIGLAYTTQFVFENLLKPHQQDRINIWLRPDKCDPKGPLYNLIQSKLAIGSGGFIGKGFLNGEMTKLNYVPEQATDFIFSIVGEEQGFVGNISVIILFLILITRSIIIAERAKLEFIRNYAYGVAGILFIHFFVNIGMTMGLMPIIGIPLPFLSRGGTSLIIFSIMLSTLIKMDASRFRT